MKEAGFTLIELILVIILVSTILSLTVLFKWPASNLNLGAETAQVVNDIRYAQALSMSNDQRYEFVITSSTSYQIANSSGSAVKNSSGAATTTLNNGITFGALSNLPNNLIAFDGAGSPYISAGPSGTALSATASIPLTANGVTMTITIAPQTGMVLVQ